MWSSMDDEHTAFDATDQSYTFTLSQPAATQSACPRCYYAQAPLFLGTLYACTPSSDGSEAVSLLHSRESGLHCRLLRPFDMTGNLSARTTEAVRLHTQGRPVAAAMSKIGDTYALLQCDADHTSVKCVQLVVLVLCGRNARCMHTLRVINVTREVTDMVSSSPALSAALSRAVPPVAALEFSPCGRYLLVLSRAPQHARVHGHYSAAFGAVAVDLAGRLLWRASCVSPQSQLMQPRFVWTLAGCVPRGIRWTDSGLWILQSRRRTEAPRAPQRRDSDGRTSCILILQQRPPTAGDSSSTATRITTMRGLPTIS